MFTTYTQALNYIQKMAAFDTNYKPGIHLERIRKFLDFVGNPQDSYPSIHVGGTSGKGSTVFLATKILAELGLKVGNHMSPHFVSLNEKYQINFQNCSDEEFIDLVNWFKGEYEKFTSETGEIVTYYESIIAMLFKHYEMQKVDAAVIEVGMGGKLDATNVLNSEVAVLNSVGLDHMEFLGDTVEKITADKMHIMKPGKTFITGITQPNLVAMIREHFEEVNPETEGVVTLVQNQANALRNPAKLLVLNEEFRYQIKSHDINGTVFDLNYANSTLANIHLKMLGDFQAHNATLAIIAVKEFLNRKFQELLPKFTPELINKAIEDAQYKGRFEIVQRDPMIVFDGAHNQQKMESFVASWKAIMPPQDIALVFSAKEGKDIMAMISALKELPIKRIYITEFAKYYYTEITSYKAEELAEKVKEIFGSEVQVEIVKDAYEAYQSMKNSLKQNETGLVTGSLYLLGKIYEKL